MNLTIDEHKAGLNVNSVYRSKAFVWVRFGVRCEGEEGVSVSIADGVSGAVDIIQPNPMIGQPNCKINNMPTATTRTHSHSGLSLLFNSPSAVYLPLYLYTYPSSSKYHSVHCLVINFTSFGYCYVKTDIVFDCDP